MSKIDVYARIFFCGAVGGAINAWLCYAELPVPVGQNTTFRWHVVPAGAAHGGVLAVAAFGLAMLLSARRLRVRLAAAFPLAWLAGFVSWIPLNWSAFKEPWSQSLTWVFQEGWGLATFGPFMYFGLVALLYYFALLMLLGKHRHFTGHVLYASAAGILGSLWWWFTWERWYFSLLHGVIWGAAVGTGTWSILRSEVIGASHNDQMQLTAPAQAIERRS